MIKAVVICEDHTLDEYVVKPIVERILADNGKKSRVQMMSNPRVRGIARALHEETMQKALDNYPMADLFLLVVDRDCDVNRHIGRFADRLVQANEAGMPAFGCLAIEEVEVWALALHAEELPDDWGTIRTDCDPKETYFEPLVVSKGWATSPGKGRKAAMREFSKKPAWDRLRARCAELQDLSNQLREWFAQQGT